MRLRSAPASVQRTRSRRQQPVLVLLTVNRWEVFPWHPAPYNKPITRQIRPSPASGCTVRVDSRRRLRHWFLPVATAPICNTFSSPGAVRIFVISDRPPWAVPSTFPTLGAPTKSHAKAANSFIEISRGKRFGSAISAAQASCFVANSSAVPMRMETDLKSPAISPAVPSAPWPVTKPIVPPPPNAGAIATSLRDSQTLVNCSPQKFAATTRRSYALPSTPTTTKTIPTVP